MEKHSAIHLSIDSRSIDLKLVKCNVYQASDNKFEGGKGTQKRTQKRLTQIPLTN